jgi:hypothetical protein
MQNHRENQRALSFAVLEDFFLLTGNNMRRASKRNLIFHQIQ